MASRSVAAAAAVALLVVADLARGQDTTASPASQQDNGAFDEEEEEEPCECFHPLDPDGLKDTCYEPVCPPGYYKCCATCKEASCYGSIDMVMSNRGMPECLRCETGDFCEGCDIFVKCPDSTQPNRPGPRISGAGSASIANCESCPRGTEASFDRSACMPKYSEVCNVDVVARCIRNCKAEDPIRGKQLTPCERMKCNMYCAKRWSEGCGAKVAEYCIFSTTRVEDLTGGVEAEEGQGVIAGCDVDCSRAWPRAPVSGAFVSGLVALVSASSLV